MKNNFDKLSLISHRKLAGKIEIQSKVKIKTLEDLSTYYTPGVAAVSLEIAKNKCKIWEYTSRSNMVVVVTDGSAVLGLGNIGAEAAHPVMAGKAILFKEFAGIDAFPICVATQDVNEIVMICKNIAPSFAGINLEDISAPRCFEIEEKLQNIGIPVMHDDQHGTAVVVLAALINATKVLNKSLYKCRITICGFGAAGTAIALMINEFTNKKAIINMVDSSGMVCNNAEIDGHKKNVCDTINYLKISGTLKDAIKNSDIFIGVSAPNIVTAEMIKSMARDAIVLALANPIPEINPEVAKSAGVKIIATGRSDFPNQVNNVLAFPGIFKGALAAKATKITPKMKLVAAIALASSVKPKIDQILPSPLNKKVVDIIAKEVKRVAISEGVVRDRCE